MNRKKKTAREYRDCTHVIYQFLDCGRFVYVGCEARWNTGEIVRSFNSDYNPEKQIVLLDPPPAQETARSLNIKLVSRSEPFAVQLKTVNSPSRFEDVATD